MDTDTLEAVRLFIERISVRYSVDRAILYGSRARRTHTDDSDADVVVVLTG